MVDNEVKPHKLATGFKSWGKRVGQSYKRVVLITSAIALVLGAIAGVTFQMEDGDSTEAFTPIGNKGTEDRNRLHATFGNMDIVPTSIVISRHDGGNIVTPAEFDASLTLHRRLMAITMANQDPTTADAKPTVTYSDLCLALPTGDCLINSMLRCFGFSTPPDSMAVTDPLCLDANGVPVITRSSLGGDIQVSAMAGVPGFFLVGSARALRYDYLANHATPGQKLNNAAWEREATKVLNAYAAEVGATHKVSFVSGMANTCAERRVMVSLTGHGVCLPQHKV